MGQFKPMVKMKTTEPSVTLKFKKGGTVKKPEDTGFMAMMKSKSKGGPAEDYDDEDESPKVHAKEMKSISNVEKKMSKHASMPASKAHAGLKTGGVVKGQGGYKTGGVVNGQGGYKKGGMAKKPNATGDENCQGAPVAMKQRPKSQPVRVAELSGTFKKGGKVRDSGSC